MTIRTLATAVLLLSIPHSAFAQGTWTNLYRAGTDGLTVDFTDAGHGFAIGASQRPMRTVNGGADWTAARITPGEIHRGVDFVSADTGWVWGDTTLFKTVDGGASWTKQDPNRQRFMEFRFLDGTYGFSKSWQGPLYATVDGGKTWLVRLNLPMGKPFLSWYFTDPAKGWAVAAEDTATGLVLLKKTSDSGVTWTAQAVPAGLKPVSVQFDDALRGRVTATDANGKLVVLTTLDGGATWRRRDTQAGGSFYEVRFATAALGFYIDFKELAPALMISRDSGATWARSPIAFIDRPARAHFVDSLVGYATGRDFISKTVDGGLTWTGVYKGIWTAMDFSSIRFADGATGWVADSRGSVLKSRDGGLVWSRQVSGRAFWKGLAVTGPMHVAAAGYLPDSGIVDTDYDNVGIITRSKDGGATWKETRLARTRMLMSLDFPSPQRGYAAALKPGGIDSTFIYKSTDGGDTWRSIVGPASNRPLRVQFMDEEFGYLATRWKRVDSLAGVFKTVDGGETWQSLHRFPGKATPLDMFWLTRERGWFLTYPLVYATVDGGLTWTASDTLKQPNMKSIRFTDADHGWIVTSASALLSTSDGGRTWQQNGFAMGGMNDVFFLPSGEGWAAGPNGGINHFQPASTRLSAPMPQAAAQPWVKFSRDGVQFTLGRPGNVRIVAMDAAGRLRVPIAEGRYPQGTHTVPLARPKPHTPWYLSFSFR